MTHEWSGDDEGVNEWQGTFQADGNREQWIENNELWLCDPWDNTKMSGHHVTEVQREENKMQNGFWTNNDRNSPNLATDKCSDSKKEPWVQAFYLSSFCLFCILVLIPASPQENPAI